MGLPTEPVSVLYLTIDTYCTSIRRLLNKRYRVIACAYFDVPSGVVTLTVERESVTLYTRKVVFPRSMSSQISRLLAKLVMLSVCAMVLSLFLRVKAKRNFDICIATHYLLGSCAILLRGMGLVKKVTYWVMDWSPSAGATKKSFLGMLVNDILFLYIDKLIVSLANSVWNLTQRIAEARLKKWRGQLEVDHQRVVYPPLTHEYLDRDSVVWSEPEKRIAFFGNLREGRGLEPAIDAIANLSEHSMQVDFLVIGRSEDDPNYTNRLLKRAVDKRVINNIKLYGFLPIEKIREMLYGSFLGIALFKGKDNGSNMVFPAKVVHYLESGIPIVVLKDSALAAEVVSNGIGFVAEYSARGLERVFSLMLSDAELVRKLRTSVREYVTRMSSGENLYKAIESVWHQSG